MTTGQMDWSSGVDSGRPTTIAGPSIPHGIKQDQLAWLINGTVRGGGVQTRTGFVKRLAGVGWSGLYQGAWMYVPDNANPYAVIAIGGSIWKVDLDTYSATNLSTAFPGMVMPPNEPLFHFVQGEQYLVIQAGDYLSAPPGTNPLFWDNSILRRSNGYIASGNPANEIPPAGPMDYYMNRIWYARQRKYIAGDILGGTHGILATTENPLALSGDGLTVPTNAGNIRSLAHAAELDTALGQGRLLIGTPKAIYRCNVPITRDDWTNVKFNNQQPLQTVAQFRYGPVGDRSTVVVNGDLFYQTLEPAIRSLELSTRYFGQWSNTPISRNENRALRFNDRSLLRYSSGIEFNNRLLQSVLPYQSPVGVAHRGILPLDFDLISSLGEKLPPAWEGLLDGIDLLQMIEGDFGGLQRAFAIVVSRKTGEIEIWEITNDRRFDDAGDGDNRIEMTIETPSYTWGNPMALKELESMELWFDKMLSSVDVTVYYRPDGYPCWIFWHAFTKCTAKDCTEDPDATQPCYPTQPYCESFAPDLTLPKPPVVCIKSNKQPSNIGNQFQVKLVIKGWARLRGLLIYALGREKEPFRGLTC